MARRYDAIVVGAGLGGLSAATMLARNGLGVLLLERHNVPGGYATSFVRGRYEFEVALHELSGIGPPDHRGPLYEYLDELGVAQRVEFIPVPELYRSVFPGLDVVLPAGPEAYEAKLCETFPHEATGIRRFLGRCYAVSREVSEITRNRGVGNPLVGAVKYRNTVRYLPTTWAEVLNRDIADPRARAVLSQYWGYFGMGPSKVSFLLFALGLTTYIKLGPCYVKGRSQALSNAFAQTFEESGGQIGFNRRVKTITTSGGRVTGVVTDDGEYVEADWIVSNADPITTCRDLIGEGNVPTGFFSRLRSRSIAASTCNVYLGIACPPEQLGLSHHENFVNVDYNTDAHADVLNVIAPPGVTLVTCYNAVDPDISPPGTTLVVLTALAGGEPWYDIPPQQYVETKNHIAESMLQAAEQIAPDIRRYAEVVEVATPITNMRYAGALAGSIYGFSNTAFDHTILRMGQRGPLGGLYFAGAWTQPGGGFEPCIMSGQIAGAMILAKIKGTQHGGLI